MAQRPDPSWSTVHSDNHANMQESSFTASDGCKLSFLTSIPLSTSTSEDVSTNPALTDRCFLLLHGFAGSSAYFDRNFAALCERQHWVVAPDLRGHGNSGRTLGGYHVARLAADLHELVAHLREQAPSHSRVRIVPVGCSLGAAVLWTYVELFGTGDFAGFIFVDQAPLQNRSTFGGGWDARVAHRTTYDAATMLRTQEAWVHDQPGAVEGLVRDCLGYLYQPEEGDALTDEQREYDRRHFASMALRCDGVWLARLMADHTMYDHREALALIDKPTLVVAGRRTGPFPVAGIEAVAQAINEQRPGLADMAVFDAGHWMFWEEPDKFNTRLLKFWDRIL